MILQCLALDDEPLALALLEEYIRKTPFLELVAGCDNAVEALHVIHTKKVDVIFSDIQMSELSGLELARVIKGLDSEKKPLLIFTTAYDQYALQGYQVDAIDYLLKPIGYEEFLRVASKARSLKESKNSVPGLKENFILFKVEYQLVKVFHDDILYIEGVKDYVKVHLNKQQKPFLSLTSLKNLEERLPADKFMRVHRSFIINLEKVNTISKNSLQIEQADIPVSDNYRNQLQAYFRDGME
jgi:DNA-binding LytR/AlgR family response regulator